MALEASSGRAASSLDVARERRLLLDRLDRWLVEQVKPYIGQRVLEVGCGHGNLTRLLLDRERVVAIDADAESVGVVQQRFGGYVHVTSLAHDITDAAVLALRREAVDTAISFNVLEHIADDVTALRHMHEVVVSGGYMIVVAPALPALYGPMDRALGHRRRYTLASMRERLALVEARSVALYYTNPLGAVGWFLNGRVLRQRELWRVQLRLFNRLVPALARAERRLRPPFGLSVVSVSQRR